MTIGYKYKGVKKKKKTADKKSDLKYKRWLGWIAEK